MKRFFTHTRTILHRVAFIVSGLIVILTSSPLHANGYEGLSPEELAKMGIYFVNGDFNCDTNNYSVLPPVDNSPSSGPDLAHSGSWTSGLQPPYILEEFMIETLKDLAGKLKVSPEDTVTEEHVVALVAFAIGEGGDINNPYLFNPLNNGLNAPDLIAGDHMKDGRQSYKSFDAGVEGLARTFVLGTQNRLGKILSDPKSTAIQFMDTLTHFEKFPGNKFWAQASVDDPNYLKQRLDYVQAVQTKYERTAALVIGTPEFEQPAHKYLPSKLKYHPTTSTTASTTDTSKGISQACQCIGAENQFGGCLSSVGGDGQITKTAMGLIWPNRDHCRVDKKNPCPGERKADATDAYRTIMPTTGAGKGQGWRDNDTFDDPAYSDCGVFVATVMIVSGADPYYPPRGTDAQRAYLERNSSGPTAKYMQVDASLSPNVSHPLQSGDILVTIKGTGHTYLYTGPQNQSKNQAAGASWGAGSYVGHVPESTAFYQDVDGQKFVAYRLIKH